MFVDVQVMIMIRRRARLLMLLQPRLGQVAAAAPAAAAAPGLRRLQPTSSSSSSQGAKRGKLELSTGSCGNSSSLGSSSSCCWASTYTSKNCSAESVFVPGIWNPGGKEEEGEKRKKKRRRNSFSERIGNGRGVQQVTRDRPSLNHSCYVSK